MTRASSRSRWGPPSAAPVDRIVLDSARIAEDTACVAVVADTHSAPNTAVDDMLARLRPSAILHAGDIGRLEVLDALAEHAPVYAVRGNIDARAPASAPDTRVIDVVAGDSALRILLTHIAVYGPRLRGEVAARAHKERAGLVVCGHSHVPFIGVDKGVTVFNAGSCGPRRFGLPIVFGVIRVGPRGIRLEHLSCETGGVWEPG